MGKLTGQKSEKENDMGNRRCSDSHSTQRFLSAHAAVHNLFNLGQHLISAKHYRLFRQRAFAPGNTLQRLNQNLSRGRRGFNT